MIGALEIMNLYNCENYMYNESLKTKNDILNYTSNGHVCVLLKA